MTGLIKKVGGLKYNDFEDPKRRTAPQVNALLKSHGCLYKAENNGDNRTFHVTHLDLKDFLKAIRLKILLRKAGFLCKKGFSGDHILYFKTW